MVPIIDSDGSANLGYRTELIDEEKQINIDMKDAEKLGYDVGYGGNRNNKAYENELLQNAYEESYEKGIDEYIKLHIDDFKKKGYDDPNKKNEQEELPFFFYRT